MNKRYRFNKAARMAALKALDMLALALANEGYVWGPKERRAYEQAIRALV